MKKIVLIIDNDLYMTDLFGLPDERDNFTVVIKGNGIAGLEYLSEHYDKVAVILIAVELPDKNGFIICKSIKEKSFLNGIPLVLMSKQNISETFEKHSKLKTRADVYLIKPLDKTTIFAFLNKVSLDAAPFLINPVLEKFPDWVTRGTSTSFVSEVKEYGGDNNDLQEILKDIETARLLLNKIEKKVKLLTK